MKYFFIIICIIVQLLKKMSSLILDKIDETSEVVMVQDSLLDNTTSVITPYKYVFEIGRCGSYDSATMSSSLTFCKTMSYRDIDQGFIESLEDCLIQPELTMFRFLCSSQCCDNQFTNNNNNVFQLVKFLLNHEVLLEFSDFSLRALICQWNKYIPEIICPWKMLSKTTSGSFTMTALKKDFESTNHYSLKMIAQLSEDNIEIKFNNAGGTILYNINEESPNIPIVISQGYIGAFIEEIYPVHSIVKINQATIIALNSHWCNLMSVESNVNITVLRDYILRTEGEDSAIAFDSSMEENIGNLPALKREVSESVRRAVSGQPQNKKTKVNYGYSDSDEEFCSTIPYGRQNTNA